MQRKKKNQGSAEDASTIEDKEFSFVCCWTCNHCVLDIGVNHYICGKTGKQLADRNNRYQVFKPCDCRQWTNKK